MQERRAWRRMSIAGTTDLHPTPERAAAALEAAGLNPYLLMERGAIAQTRYPEVRLGASWNRFDLLTLEELPVPALRADDAAALADVAREQARRWGLVWRGSIEAGRVEIAFGGEVPYRVEDDPDDAGLRLHDAILAAHHAHQSFRQRTLNLAWRASDPSLSVTA